MKYDLGLACRYAIKLDGQDLTANCTDDIFIGINKNIITCVESISNKNSIKKYKKHCKKFINAPHHVVIPGFVNAHTHLAMTLLRGIADDLPLEDWLHKFIFPLESSLVSPEFVKDGTELAALECLRFGTTTINDMYFFPETTAEVLKKAGIRGYVAQCFANHPLPDNKKINSFDQFLSLQKKLMKNSMIKAVLAPHAPYTCSDELLKKISKLSNELNARIHIHVSESRFEVDESFKNYGKSPIQRLMDLNILGSKTMIAHGVHLDQKDLDLISQTETSIIHNPDSNTKLASGVAPIRKYLEQKITVALGTDGAASCNDLSLFGVMDLTAKLQKVTLNKSSGFKAEESLWLAIKGGARALGLEHEIGSIEIGKKADLVLIDINFPHLTPHNNLVSDLVYCAQGLEVDTVITDGIVRVKNKKVLSLDFEKVQKKALKWRKKIQSFQPPD
jgi:5-methylthioadenosine/S-adenosylhomocysteine deaminase